MSTPTPTPSNQILIGDGFVPVIDVSAARSGNGEDRQQVADIIGNTCRESGFLVIVGHGVPESTIARLHEESMKFFHLPEDEKEALRHEPDDKFTRGYNSAGSLDASNDDSDVSAMRAIPDLMERFIYNPMGDPNAREKISWVSDPQFDDAMIWLQNKWPTDPNFRSAVLEYFDALSVLTDEIMHLFALALGLPEAWFDATTDQPVAQLVINHYPPQITPPEEGQLRLGKHSDWGSLTILYQDDEATGLQVLNKAGVWCDVPVVPGAFVVNIGDLMRIWTNEMWVSTVHRVQNPPRELAHTERLSIPFFCQPNHDALIEPIPTCVSSDNPAKYDPVISGHYLLEKYMRAYG